MYEDLTPELVLEIKREFKTILSTDEGIRGVDRKVRQGKATQLDVRRYVELVGVAASTSLKKVLKLEILPDATMYAEIAEQTITPALEELYAVVNTEAAIQLRGEDRKAEMDIAISKGKASEDRIKQVVDMASGQTSQDALDNALAIPVVTVAHKYYDDFLRDNAELRESLGFEEVVVRKYDDKGLHGGKDVCQWCKAREGTWSLNAAYANGVFERHPGCECTITVATPDKPQAQASLTLRR